MVIKGEVLQHIFTVAFTAHGDPGNWGVIVTGPGHMTRTAETQDERPFRLLDQMINGALRDCCEYFPKAALKEKRHAKI